MDVLPAGTINRPSPSTAAVGGASAALEAGCVLGGAPGNPSLAASSAGLGTRVNAAGACQPPDFSAWPAASGDWPPYRLQQARAGGFTACAVLPSSDSTTFGERNLHVFPWRMSAGARSRRMKMENAMYSQSDI